MSDFRVALYHRSSDSESAANGLANLQDIAASRGWAVVATIAEQRSTGTTSACSGRPGLDDLLYAAARHEIDVLIVRSLSHLAGTLPALIRVVNELRGHGIDLLTCDDAIDTTVPAGKAAFSAFAALATFEREQIRERARVSLQRARRNGTRLGRPTNVNTSVNAAIVALRERGFSIRRIAAELRVGNRSVYAAIEAARAARGPELSGNPDNGFGTPLKPLARLRNGARV